MVKTRHTSDAYDESGQGFVTIDGRRSKKQKSPNDTHEDGSDDSGVVQFRPETRPGRRRNIVSPQNKRSLRTAAKRVSYVEDDNIDDDFPTPHSARRTRHTVIHDDSDDHEDGADVDQSEPLDGSGGREPVSRGRTRGQARPTPESPGRPSESPERPKRERRRTSDYLVAHPSPRQLKHELLDMADDDGIRRSSRQRKLMYSTFEEAVLGRTPCVEIPAKRKRQRTESEMEEHDGDQDDMYSHVKRKRVEDTGDLYNIEAVDQSGHQDSDNSSSKEDSSDDDDEEEDEPPQPTQRGYFLRENKPRTQLYNVDVQERKRRSQIPMFSTDMETPGSPGHRRRSKLPTYMSPARRKVNPSRRRRAFHGASSSTSSSESSSDEERFQRRKTKSMMRARSRCLPMNLDPNDMASSSILHDRQKIGASLADVDPMTIDRSVTFESVGGLGKHIRALKEMIVFPLMYPEIFERFKITPPRGVLFYGPPGTGKTLVARALANECSSGDKRVSFYMRKGADCLSKWVGESERQLRLLFDQAYQTRPSIIFFDEIDGLAPVRSSRQDQIHSSIVSTLLALMDGLDCRGEIVVIGATNRIDSIDPALRRPGRFDREFLFPLPSLQARGQILKINTKEWNPRLCDRFVGEVAEKCVGYCGADVRSLCTEAALLALRRRYPQIYSSSEKLEIDASSINVNARDFYNGMQNIVPTSQRSVTSPGRALSQKVKPLLEALLKNVLASLNDVFPSVLSQLSSLDGPAAESGETGGAGDDTELLDSDDDADQPSIWEHKPDRRKKRPSVDLQGKFLDFSSYATRRPATHRPRLLLCGVGDQGQTSHIAPAALHCLEQLPVHVLDLPALYAVGARTPEEACAQTFREARRTCPSIIYLPHLNQWWGIVGDTVRSTLLSLIQDLDPASPVLILVTSEEKHADLEYDIQELFCEYFSEVIAMRNPTSQERREFFSDLLLNQATRPPPQRKVAAASMLEVLPKAAPPTPRQLTQQEKKKLDESDEATLRELRLFLRELLNKLGRDRKFGLFAKPVDIEDVPDYYEIIIKPMDLSTMMSKIDLHQYQSVRDFIDDVDQICLNALEYNPDKDAQSRIIRHRACTLKDTAYALVKAELDPEFEKLCLGIVESRKRRGVQGEKSAPAFYHTRPLNQGPMHPLAFNKHTPDPPAANPNVRTSRRLRGFETDEAPPLEQVERTARMERKLQMSPSKESLNNATPQECLTKRAQSTSGGKSSQEKSSTKRKPMPVSAKSSAKKPPAKRSIWGRSGYTRRRKTRKSNLDMSETVEIETEESEAEDAVADSGASDMETDSVQPDASESSQEVNEQSVKRDATKALFFDKGSTLSSLELDTHSGKSPSRVSGIDCLSIDVGLKTPRDNQKSPRSDNRKSPRSRHSSGPIIQPRHDSPQKSPQIETEQSSPVSTSPTRTRHESGQKSPQTSDLRTDSSHRSPRHVSSPQSEKNTNKLSPKPKINHGADNVHPAQDSITQEKSASATGVPLVNGFVDSGLGSSDSSNGDSNDSTGKTQQDTTVATVSEPQPGTSTELEVASNCVSEATEQTSQDVEMEASTSTSPTFRVTRGRTATLSQQHAMEVLQEGPQPLVVDRDRLSRLLDMTVLLTEAYTVSKLEKLHSVFSQCIYQHRQQYNKTKLTQDLEEKLRHFTSQVSKGSQSTRTTGGLAGLHT